MSWARKRRRQTGTSIAEFAVSLMIIFPVLFLLLSISSFICGYLSINFAAQTAAREAGATSTQKDAKAIVLDITNRVLEGPLGKFGGVTQGKLDLTVQQAANGSTNFVDWDGVSANARDNVYRYSVTGTCKIQPVMWPQNYDMQAQPSVCVVEHPQGLVIKN
jgi:hypothetical protein